MLHRVFRSRPLPLSLNARRRIPGELLGRPLKALQDLKVQQVNEINIGKSPCARGNLGHECRMNLKNAALSCTSGKCHQCQQCGSVPVNDWITCCRDHFLCCRPLARSCQRCDQPLLTSFCNVAFGKCK
ncbi:hypothetical protein Avbf_02736 [Armadillidium vulgare]|nr:hypothetical protein Avbf_02736 [Armadillidium vulgare]